MTGKITDKVTNEPIYNVQIFASDANGLISDPPVGTTTNFDGDYVINPTTGFVTAKHISYTPVTIPIPMGGSTLNIQMQAGHELPPVEIIYDNRPWYVKYKYQLAGGALIAIAGIIFFSDKKQNQ